MLIPDYPRDAQGALDGTLTDPQPQAPNPAQVEFRIEVDQHSINIGVDGFSDATSAFGYARPIRVEYYDGKLRVLVWADVNKEDPTHVIDMSGAAEALYRDPRYHKPDAEDATPDDVRCQ